jgi:hypothetical protein
VFGRRRNVRRKFVPVLIYPAVIVSTIALAMQENVPPPQALAEVNDIRQLLEMTGAAKAFIPLLPAMLAPLKKALPKVPEEYWDEFSKGFTAEGSLSGLFLYTRSIIRKMTLSS